MLEKTRDLSDALLSRARNVAGRIVRMVSVVSDKRKLNLRIEIREDEIDGGYVARCIDLPGCGSQGDTVQEAIDNIIEAIAGVLEARMQREVPEGATRERPTPGRPQNLALKISV